MNSVKAVLKIKDDPDFWDELNDEDQAAINEGIAQLDKGQYASHETVREEIRKRHMF